MYSDDERKAASEHARSIFEIMMNNRAKTELDKMIELAHEIPISQMIVKREIGRELNAAVMQRALKMMEEEEHKRGEYL